MPTQVSLNLDSSLRLQRQRQYRSTAIYEYHAHRLLLLRISEQAGYQVWENNEKTVPKAPYRAFLDGRAALSEEEVFYGK